MVYIALCVCIYIYIYIYAGKLCCTIYPHFSISLGVNLVCNYDIIYLEIIYLFIYNNSERLLIIIEQATLAFYANISMLFCFVLFCFVFLFILLFTVAILNKYYASSSFD